MAYTCIVLYNPIYNTIHSFHTTVVSIAALGYTGESQNWKIIRFNPTNYYYNKVSAGFLKVLKVYIK